MHNPYDNRIPSVLSFFPNTNGVGWSFFAQNAVFHDARMMRSRKRNVSEYVARMRKLIDEHLPHTVVFPEPTKKRGKRVNEIVEMVSVYAQSRGIEVRKHSEDDKKFVWGEMVGTVEDYYIGQALMFAIPELDEFKYEKRHEPCIKNGKKYTPVNEPYYSAVLKSVIYAFTHFYYYQ